MANEFYSASGWPASKSAGVSNSARAELLLVQGAFDKLPPLAANAGKVVFINGGGTAMTATGVSGTGLVAMTTSPVFTTPNIGAATATSINGVIISGTAGKQIFLANTLTIGGTDGATLNIAGGGTLGSAAFTAASAYAASGAAFFVGTTSITNNRGSGAQALTGITSIDGSAATCTTIPALTGVINSSGASNATTFAGGSTGSGAVVLATSPTLVTPVLGVATATSINGVAIAGSGTLNVGTGGTLGTAAFQNSSTFALVAGQTFTGAVRATRVSEEINTLTPGAGAGATIDWSNGGSKLTNNGTNVLTFTNVPSGCAGHTLRVTNLANTTFPAAVDWGVAGKPVIAGAATVVLVTMDSGTTVWAGIQHRSV